MGESAAGRTFTLVLGMLFVAVAQVAAQISLERLAPENYRYEEATRCVNCKQNGADLKYRAVGIDMSSGSPVLDSRGWLGSVHSRSQSHGDRVNTVCAWCHAPLTDGATRDEEAAAPIEKGTWQGVTCGACHPSSVPEEERHSQLANFLPGSDPTAPTSYEFRDRSDPAQFNAQCRYCHHESHEVLSEAKTAMLEAGTLRCVDCHMAGYAAAQDGVIERFHNMRVEANLPYSCNGAYGTEMSCHTGGSTEWMQEKIEELKGPRKDW